MTYNTEPAKTTEHATAKFVVDVLDGLDEIQTTVEPEQQSGESGKRDWHIVAIMLLPVLFLVVFQAATPKVAEQLEVGTEEVPTTVVVEARMSQEEVQSAAEIPSKTDLAAPMEIVIQPQSPREMPVPQPEGPQEVQEVQAQIVSVLPVVAPVETPLPPQQMSPLRKSEIIQRVSGEVWDGKHWLQSAPQTQAAPTLETPPETLLAPPANETDAHNPTGVIQQLHAIRIVEVPVQSVLWYTQVRQWWCGFTPFTARTCDANPLVPHYWNSTVTVSFSAVQAEDVTMSGGRISSVRLTRIQLGELVKEDGGVEGRLLLPLTADGLLALPDADGSLGSYASLIEGEDEVRAQAPEVARRTACTSPAVQETVAQGVADALGEKLGYVPEVVFSPAACG